MEFLSVLDATFSYHTQSPDNESSPPSEASKTSRLEHITKTQELFTRIAKEDGKKDRSGLLGLLELEKRARQHGLSQGPIFTFLKIPLDLTDSDLDAERFVSLMQQYFEDIGDKACCFEDLKPYLVLEGTEFSRWTSFLESVPSSFVSGPESSKLIFILISL